MILSPAIQKISFANNNIRALPDEIGACTTLEELYMSNNAKFSYFPSTAGHLRFACLYIRFCLKLISLVRRLKELSLSRCPALKQFPNTATEMTALRELDLRAAKKQVCKISPEVVDVLKTQFCKVRGGVVKKSKGGKKKAS
jgi:Leucine-rich repeat (LRR) protein